MSAPASACEAAVRASSSIVASLSTRPSARSGPQWPWSVYSHRQVSAISTRSRSASRRRRSVSWTMPSAIQPPVPMASFSAGRPNRITPPTPSAGERPGVLARPRPGVTRSTPGIEPTGSRRPRPGIDEQRRDELARVDPRLADEGAQRLGPARCGGGGGRGPGAAPRLPAAGSVLIGERGSSGGSGGGVVVGEERGRTGSDGVGDAEGASGERGEVGGGGRRRGEHGGEAGCPRRSGRRRAGRDRRAWPRAEPRPSPSARASRPRAVEPLVRISGVDRAVVEGRGEQRPGGLRAPRPSRRRPRRSTAAPRAREGRPTRPASAMSARGTRTRSRAVDRQLARERLAVGRGRDEDVRRSRRRGGPRRSPPPPRPSGAARLDLDARGGVEDGTRGVGADVSTIAVGRPATRGERRVEGAARGRRADLDRRARGRRRRPRSRSAVEQVASARPAGRATSTRGPPRSATTRAARRSASAARSAAGAASPDPGHAGAGSTGALGSGVQVRAAPATSVSSPVRATVPIAPIGDRQPPPVPASSVALGLDGGARGRVVQAARRPRSPRRRRPGPGARASPGRAPRAISADGRISSIRSARPSRVSPATARTSASESPRSSLASRVSTLPWSGWSSQVRAQRPEERDPARAVGARRGPRAGAWRASCRGPGRRARRADPRAAGRRRSPAGRVLVGGDVLRGVDREVHARRRAARRRSAPTNAPSPQAVSTGRSSPSVRMISISRGDAVLGEAGGHPAGLDERELAAAGADAEGPGHGALPGPQSENSARAARSRSPVGVLAQRRRAARAGGPATRRWLICSTSSRSWSARSRRRNRRSSSSARRLSALSLRAWIAGTVARASDPAGELRLGRVDGPLEPVAEPRRGSASCGLRARSSTDV